jgi:hypothetical protein
MKIRLVSVSPEGDKVDLKITRLAKYALQAGATAVQGQDVAAAFTPEELTAWGYSPKTGFVKDVAHSKVVNEKGVRVEESVFNLTVPGVSTIARLARSTGSLAPALAIEYGAKGAKSGRSDQGFLSFFLLPRPGDAGVRTTLESAAREFGTEVPSEAELAKRAKRNTPPVLTAISPKSGASSGTKFDLMTNLAGTDRDPQAKTRFQWFVTRGKLGNQRARKTSWDAEGAGRAGAFVVVRDLQGGVDYRYTHVEVK